MLTYTLISLLAFSVLAHKQLDSGLITETIMNSYIRRNIPIQERADLAKKTQAPIVWFEFNKSDQKSPTLWWSKPLKEQVTEDVAEDLQEIEEMKKRVEEVKKIETALQKRLSNPLFDRLLENYKGGLAGYYGHGNGAYEALLKLAEDADILKRKVTFDKSYHYYPFHSQDYLKKVNSQWIPWIPRTRRIYKTIPNKFKDKSNEQRESPITLATSSALGRIIDNQLRLHFKEQDE